MILAQAQDTGVRFETGLSWKAIQEKARRENKNIFVDCYASWCGPCKKMDKIVYPDKDVGAYFNAHFISIKIQMDKTPKDGSEIQEWYSDADSLSKNIALRHIQRIYSSPQKEKLFIR